MSEDAIEERFRSIDKTVEIHEKRLNNLEKTYQIMEKMEFRMDLMEKSMSSINEKLDTQVEDKGKKWDKLIDYIFYSIIAAILTYLCMKIGIK